MISDKKLHAIEEAAELHVDEDGFWTLVSLSPATILDMVAEIRASRVA